jgi:dimethylamine/trimethylamine dehydrogenase
MGGVLAAHLARAGCRVTIVTPEPIVSAWTVNTLESNFIAVNLAELGVDQMVRHDLVAASAEAVSVQHVVTGARTDLAADALVLVTARDPVTALVDELRARSAEWAGHGLKSVRRMGDCDAPAMVAHAVHAGHLYARQLDENGDPDALPFRVERLL